MCYLAVYLLDLRRRGYGWLDVGRVYALNLLLIPVNLGGLLLSLRQVATGRKPRFVRTPKAGGAVSIPGLAVVAELAMLSFWLLFAVHRVVDGRIEQALFVLVHVGLLAYAIARFIGWQAALANLLADCCGLVGSGARGGRSRKPGLARRRIARTALGPS